MKSRLCLLIVLTCISAQGATYTVAPSGGDYTTFAALVAAHTLTSDDVVRFQAASIGGSATFDERLVPNGSGTSGHPITIYGRYGDTITVRGINGGTRNYISVYRLQFTQPSTSYNYDCILLSGCSGWVIEDNYFYDTYGGGVNGAFNTVNSSNIIRHNVFSNIGGTDNGSSTPTVIQMYGDSNLIEYNTALKSLDRTRCFGTGNVVRNNYWGATDTSYYTGTSPYPNHTDGFQSYAPTSRLVQQLLYERNYDTDNADTVGHTNGHGFLVQDSANNANWLLLRFNLLIRESGTGFQFQNVTRIYGYNDTVIAVKNGATSAFGNAVTYDAPGAGTGMDLQDWRNNTWSYCPNCIDGTGIITTTNRGTNFTSAVQHSYNVGTQGTLPAGASPSNLAQTDPLFVDGVGVAGHDNYNLQSGSPLKAAGTAITTAVGAGSTSSTLTVVDAHRLFDGWGIADADWIKIGSGAYVQISSINYGTNVVTISATRSWGDGDSVFVQGTEDVGALPYGSAVPSGIYARAGNNYTVTVSGSARFVEFIEDGLPRQLTYASPYTYTSSGGTVNINIYALYATNTPVISAIAQSANVPASTILSPAKRVPSLSF